MIMNVYEIRKNPVPEFLVDLLVYDQLVIISWFQLLNLPSLAPDREGQSRLIRSPQPAGA